MEDDFNQILLNLNSPDPEVRVAAIDLIGQYGALYDDEGQSSSAVPQVSRALLTDESRAVRWSAAYALGAIGETAGLASLIEALGRAEADGDIGLQIVILKALGKIGGSEAVVALESMLGRAKIACLQVSTQRALKWIRTAEAHKANAGKGPPYEA